MDNNQQEKNAMTRANHQQQQHQEPAQNSVSAMGGGAPERMQFMALTEHQQEQARARFIDAGPSDGYLYELDRDGGVLSRRRKAARAWGGDVWSRRRRRRQHSQLR